MSLDIIIGDIFEKSVDAIVVPITSCNKISSKFAEKLYKLAGYDNLMNERKKIGHLHCGKSAITSGYNLKAKYIIHTAVPLWKNNLNNETRKIEECYFSALKSANDIRAGSVSFPLLGTGKNGFPKDIVRKIAENVINDFLLKSNSLMKVYLVITPKVAKSLSDKYGEYKLSDEERFSMYKNKYQMELKASELPVDDYNRKRVEFYLNKYIINRESIINTTNWDKSSLSRFISGKTTKPKKDKVISLAIQMGLNEEERFEFINCTGYSYPENEKDWLIESKLSSGCTDFYKLNDELYSINKQYSLSSSD